MGYRIFRHPDVERDLNGIVDLIVEFAGVETADKKLSQIEQTINRLTETPHIGTIRDDIFPGLRAIPTARKGVICFVVDDEEQAVYIVSLSYAGADWLSRVGSRI